MRDVRNRRKEIKGKSDNLKKNKIQWQGLGQIRKQINN